MQLWMQGGVIGTRAIGAGLGGLGGLAVAGALGVGVRAGGVWRPGQVRRT